MKEPERIPLTDNPRSKKVKTIPLRKDYNEYETDFQLNETYSKNNSQSIQQLESDSTN